MDDSQLIVFTFKQPLYCCSFIQASLMACSSNTSLLFWDFAEGKLIASFPFPQEVAPIALTTIRVSQQRTTLLLQLKETRVLIINFQKESKQISIYREYQLDMIGFTKLSITSHHYGHEGNLTKLVGEYFWTIRYSNTFERRTILAGEVERQMLIDETQFEEVGFLLTYSISNITYLLVAEEGGTFKQFALLQESDSIEPSRIMTLPARPEMNIVLSVEPIPNHRAYVCMRNEHVYIINLKELQVEQELKLTAFRIIKEIPHSKKDKLYVIAAKSEICLLKDNCIKCRQKIDKSFIMDIDTFQWGVIGVTEEGKIFLLPLL